MMEAQRFQVFDDVRARDRLGKPLDFFEWHFDPRELSMIANA
jgi:hypothetical protein